MLHFCLHSRGLRQQYLGTNTHLLFLLQCLVTAQDHYLVETILAFNTNDNNTLQ